MINLSSKSIYIQSLYWGIRSILITFITMFISLYFFGDYHSEIGTAIFWFSILLAIFAMWMGNIIYKYTQPISYARYKSWYDEATYSNRIVMLPLFGYLSFFIGLLESINQYNVTTPVRSVNTIVINKYINHDHGSASYCTQIFIKPGRILLINNHELYNMLHINDRVIVKIQQGRLVGYFATELVVVNNGYKILL